MWKCLFNNLNCSILGKDGRASWTCLPEMEGLRLVMWPRPREMSLKISAWNVPCWWVYLRRVGRNRLLFKRPAYLLHSPEGLSTKGFLHGLHSPLFILTSETNSSCPITYLSTYNMNNLLRWHIMKLPATSLQVRMFQYLFLPLKWIPRAQIPLIDIPTCQIC